MRFSLVPHASQGVLERFSRSVWLAPGLVLTRLPVWSSLVRGLALGLVWFAGRGVQWSPLQQRSVCVVDQEKAG